MLKQNKKTAVQAAEGHSREAKAAPCPSKGYSGLRKWMENNNQKDNSDLWKANWRHSEKMEFFCFLLIHSF